MLAGIAVMLTACTKETSTPAVLDEDTENDMVISTSEEQKEPETLYTFSLAAPKEMPKYRAERTVADENILPDYDQYEDKYSRLSDGEIGLYKAGTSDGYVFPFVTKSYVNINTEYTVYKYGFADEAGKIVSDYGYDSVEKDGEYWKARAGEDMYYISLDGTHVVKTLASNKWETPGTVVEHSDEYFYEVSGVLDEQDKTLGSISSVRERIFDLSGKVIKENNIHLGEALSKAPIDFIGFKMFSVAATEILDGRYLKVLNYDDNFDGPGKNAGFASSIIDLDKMSIVMQEYYAIKMFENYTFAARKYDSSRYILYNCQGEPVNDESFYYIEYLDCDCYLVKDGENTVTRIVKLEDGIFTKVATLEAGNYYKSDGFVVTKNEDNYGCETYYLFDGTKVYPETYEKAKVYEIAMSQGDVWYKNMQEVPLSPHGATTGTKDYLDITTEASSDPRYYGFDVTYDYMTLIDMSDNSVLWAISKAKETDDNFISTVQNGIMCHDNKLIDVLSGELIFKYTAKEQ